LDFRLTDLRIQFADAHGRRCTHPKSRHAYRFDFLTTGPAPVEGMIDGYRADGSRSPSPSPRHRYAVGAGRARASQRGAFSLATNHPSTGTGPVVRSRKIESQYSTVHRDSRSKFQIPLARPSTESGRKSRSREGACTFTGKRSVQNAPMFLRQRLRLPKTGIRRFSALREIAGLPLVWAACSEGPFCLALEVQPTPRQRSSGMCVSDHRTLSSGHRTQFA